MTGLEPKPCPRSRRPSGLRPLLGARRPPIAVADRKNQESARRNFDDELQALDGELAYLRLQAIATRILPARR
jgi:hypothetical protein